jgi:hypothetical protein
MNLRLANILFFSIMIVMNYLANALPLNGKSTGALSDQYPNLFVPAGITFSIWGIIYLLLLIFSILQFLPKYADAVKKISPFILLNFGLNAVWIFVWHYEYVVLSVLVMLGLLYSLIQINKVLNQHSFEYAKVTFGIYLGWICIATIANFTTLFVDIQWDAFSIPHEYWAIAMIAIGCVIVAVAMIKLNPYLGISVCWAFLGIYLKRQADYPLIAYFAVSALVVLALFFLALQFKKRNSKV